MSIEYIEYIESIESDSVGRSEPISCVEYMESVGATSSFIEFNE